MADSSLQKLYEQVEKSEKVLLGLGEAFQYDWEALLCDQRYKEIEAEIGGNKDYVWIIPFLQKMVLRRPIKDKWKRAYDRLKEMLTDKDYFIVSLCMDDYVYEAGFEEKRIVTPCGGFRKMQCDNNCNHELSDIPFESYNEVLRYYRGEIPIEALKEPTCAKCGDKLRFNQLGVTKYAEEGYLDSWDSYTRWIQNTVNKKLCVLELGVGMEYPTIIRFPFEKIVFYNQKAFMYRIHSRLYQVSKETGDRGMGIRADAVEYLCGKAEQGN